MTQQFGFGATKEPPRMADDKPKSRVDKSREAGPTGITRRFVGVTSTGRAISGTFTESVDFVSAKAKADRKPRAKRVLKRAEKTAKPLAKPKARANKRGRPPAEKPWEKEGISRSTWLRRGNRKGKQ